MALQIFTQVNKPQKGDSVLWNWRKGTRATVIGFSGKQVRIAYAIDKNNSGEATVFPSSLKLIERPERKKIEAEETVAA